MIRDKIIKQDSFENQAGFEKEKMLQARTRKDYWPTIPWYQEIQASLALHWTDSLQFSYRLDELKHTRVY